MSRLVALHAGGSPEPWQQLGISCVSDVCQLADVQLRVGGRALRWESVDEDIWVTDAVLGRYPSGSVALAS